MLQDMQPQPVLYDAGLSSNPTGAYKPVARDSLA